MYLPIANETNKALNDYRFLAETVELSHDDSTRQIDDRRRLRRLNDFSRWKHSAMHTITAIFNVGYCN